MSSARRPNAFLKAQAHRLKPGMTALAARRWRGPQRRLSGAPGARGALGRFLAGRPGPRRGVSPRQHGVKLATECADLANGMGRGALRCGGGDFHPVPPRPNWRTRIFAGMRKRAQARRAGADPGLPARSSSATAPGGPKDAALLYTPTCCAAEFRRFRNPASA